MTEEFSTQTCGQMTFKLTFLTAPVNNNTPDVFNPIGLIGKFVDDQNHTCLISPLKYIFTSLNSHEQK